MKYFTFFHIKSSKSIYYFTLTMYLNSNAKFFRNTRLYLDITKFTVEKVDFDTPIVPNILKFSNN